MCNWYFWAKRDYLKLGKQTSFSLCHRTIASTFILKKNLRHDLKVAENSRVPKTINILERETSLWGGKRPPLPF